MNNEENCYSVYKHTTPSNKVYIGITRQRPEKRWQYGYGYRRQRNIHFENAINKYGLENIKHEVLFDGLSEKEAKEKEVELIAFYDSTNRDKGYNISPGGSAQNPESIKKALSTKKENGTWEKESARMKAKWKDPIWRANHVAKMQNKPRTEEQKEHYKAASAKRIGTHLSDETKAKLSAIHKTKTGEKSSRAKKVYQIDIKSGNVLNTYATARQAAIAVEAKSISAISNCCRGDNGKNHFCKGYYWCYEEDYDWFIKTIEFNRSLTTKGLLSKNPRIICMETRTIYESVSELAKDLCIKDSSSITQQIYGERKTIHGYTFNFVDENGTIIHKEKPESGRRISENHKEAVSKAHRKPVMCIETGEVFKSSLEAIEAVGLKKSSASMIRRQIDGKLKNVKGYTWKYVY